MTTSRIARDTTRSDALETAEAAAKLAAPASEKTLLRVQLLAARKSMTLSAKAAAEGAICARLLTWLQNNALTSLGVYWPIRQEPDLHSAYNALSAQGVHLSLPIIRGKELPLEFIRWSPGDALVKDALGTSVPVQGEVVQPQALLIPCLGFNAARLRLGYGGGFYDRTLAQTPRPLALGIAYTDAQVDFAAEPHDIALDLIISGP